MKKECVILMVVAALVGFLPQSKADVALSPADNGNKAANVSWNAGGVSSIGNSLGLDPKMDLAIAPTEGLNMGGLKHGQMMNGSPQGGPGGGGDPVPDMLEPGALTAGAFMLWFGARKLGIRVLHRKQSTQ
jgi:hypothetical protein